MASLDAGKQKLVNQIITQCDEAIENRMEFRKLALKCLHGEVSFEELEKRKSKMGWGCCCCSGPMNM